MTFSRKEMDALTRTGLDLISQALSIFDSDLRLAVCNRRYREMFALPERLTEPGVSFEETIRYLVGRGEYGDIDDPKDAIAQRVAAARTFVPHYLERRRANGSWLSVEGFPLPTGGWVAVYTDITEVRIQQQLLRTQSAELSEQLLSNAERLSEANRELSAANSALRATQAQLTEMEARTRLTTEMMPAHIAHVGTDLVYTYTNRRLASVIPDRPSQIVGRHISDALGEATFTKITPALNKALSGSPSVLEFTDTASARRIRVAFTPDRIDDGPINGVYILSMDITEESQARAAVTQSRKRALAAQLTSGLAHDFSNLLTIILGMQSRLGRIDLPAEAQSLVASTVGAARRGGALLDRIAAVSGHREMRPVAVDIAGFLDDLTIMAQATLPDGITFAVDAEAFDKRLLLDPDALQDSLLNLILNARDAIGQTAGEISLTVTRVHDTWISFRVTDTGNGFLPEALEQGCDPFFSTKGGEGSGLGLAMVFDQTTLAGGIVKLANGQNCGGAVTIRLPYRAAPDASHSGLVLLVDDSDDIRETVREMLRDLGHTVVEAASAEEALALSDIPDIAMVLTDLHLRGARSGLELADLLCANVSKPIAVMTSAPPADALRAAAAARFPLLPKPFDSATLARFLPTVMQ